MRKCYPKIIERSALLLISVFFVSSCGGGGGGSAPAIVVQNSAPTISGSTSTIRVGEALYFTPSANDADGDNLVFSIVGMPAWASFDTASGLLSGSAVMSDLASISSITITVSDGQLSSSISFDLTVTKPIFFISIGIDSLDTYRNMDIELSGCFIAQNDVECNEDDELLTIAENGLFTFQAGLETGAAYSLKVDRDPGRQDCALELMEGVVGSSDKTIDVACAADASAPLFALDKMHKIRVSMDVDEWHRFVLDTERARYSTGDANGNISEWTSWSHSEIYRQVDFEYLDADGTVIEKFEKVGFKMKGNTSRQWPEYWYDQGGDNWTAKPKRFSFGIKFDEEFDEDEGVYSCIDATGQSAAVEGAPCYFRVGKDHAEVPENDKREFMDVDKLSFRFNRDDPSYQRELLAHDILNSIGVPAARVAHANVEFHISGDGDFYGRGLPQTYNMGVYQMVEQIDKPFLKRYFGKNGYLFKMGGNADLAGSAEVDNNCIAYEDAVTYIDPNFCQIGVEKSDPESREEWLGTANYLNPQFVNSDINDGGEDSQFRPYKPAYDLKSKKSSIADGRVLLQDFMNFVQTYPSAVTLADHFDIPGFIKAQAAEIVVGAVDHYVRVANNYYLYFNPLTDQWVYMVNDFDFVFRDSHDISMGLPSWFAAFRDIAGTYAFPSAGKVDWASRELGSVDPILWDIVFSEQSNKEALYSDIKEILDNHMDWNVIGTKLAARDALVTAAIRQTDAGLPDGCGFIYNPAAINATADTTLCDASDLSIKQFIALRRETLYQELQENGL
tara:strand:+ start:665 stop:3031 length:2367 start_codon:yes stop_codon:yes gene_type:complete